MSGHHTPISQLMFRVPEDLHEQLEAQATANQRSLNAEVVARLKASFTGGNAACDTSEMEARMHRMEELVQESTTAADA
jgi:plasmid stability protein